MHRHIAILLLLAAAADAPRAATVTSDRIVFSSDRSGQPQLYTMTLPGAKPVLLCPSPNGQRRPDVAPNGKTIVFESHHAAGVDISRLDVGTGRIARLTTTGTDGEPRWSPDGARIAFSTRRDGDSAIYVMNADGGAAQRLSPPGAFDRAPAWSPDGTRIALCAVDGDDEHVLVMAADGTGRGRLTTSAGESSMPSWSPDGGTIVFNHSKNDIHDAIMIIDADGGEARPLGSDPNLRTKYMDRNTASWGPVFDPSGRRILFTSVRSGNAEIYSMNADGANVRPVTTDRAQDFDPAWLPASFPIHAPSR